MIPANLLSALREKDPELWARYAETDLSREEERIDEPWRTAEANEAWLQYCLQEAIRARGWCYRTRYIDWVWVDIFDACDETLGEAECYTEAEALLRAYLTAIQEAA